MARQKKPLPLWENIPVTGWGANGKALAKVDGLVVFITGAVPGDVADLRITKKKSSFAEADAVRIATPSPDRIPAFCAHFGTCGGCKWQDLDYAKQLAYKQQQVVDNLERLGGLELPAPPSWLHRIPATTATNWSSPAARTAGSPTRNCGRSARSRTGARSASTSPDASTR